MSEENEREAFRERQADADIAAGRTTIVDGLDSLLALIESTGETEDEQRDETSSSEFHVRFRRVRRVQSISEPIRQTDEAPLDPADPIE